MMQCIIPQSVESPFDRLSSAHAHTHFVLSSDICKNLYQVSTFLYGKILYDKYPQIISFMAHVGRHQ